METQDIFAEVQKQEKMNSHNSNSDYDISIVIVNYNVKDFLYQCISSIKQASNNLAIQTIVVDNNSEDNSVEFIKNRFPEVDVIALQENIGFGKANNVGFDIASGRYILILNPDTLLSTDTLDVMHEYMENHPYVGISVCKVLNPDGTFQESCRRGFPTPWSAFSKLFGLQSLFPKSKLFGRYNLTYMPVDETYFVDAVTGAFMFAKAEAIREVNGFDTDYFMYAEDLDLCYRVNKAGYKIAYVHSTKIIHYKGESSRRSRLNEINLFYEAMEIFVSKHYSNYGLFLLLLKLGIVARSALSYAYKYRSDIKLMLLDSIFISLGIILGTYMALGSPFGLQPYAYPTVFIAVIGITVFANIITGEYFESSGSPTKTIFGYAISFLILSTLIYFFPDYRFSRGALLVTIAFGLTNSALIRIAKAAAVAIKQSYHPKRIIIVGDYSMAKQFKNFIGGNSAYIVGYIHDKPASSNAEHIKWLGTLNHLNSIVESEDVSDVVFTNSILLGDDFYHANLKFKHPGIRVHSVAQFEDYIVSDLISEITDNEKSKLFYKANLLRYRIIKRSVDIIVSSLLFTIGLLVILFLNTKDKKLLLKIFNVFKGKYSFIGILELPGKKNFGKPGLTGLAHLSQSDNLSESAIQKLNEYYLKYYSVSLDFDILLKLLYKKRWRR